MTTINQILKITFLALIMLSTLAVKAQEKQSKEKIEALKIAYITEKLELTEQESKDFWPLYQSYSKDKKNLRSNKKDINKSSLDSMTDAEIEQLIDDKFIRERKSLDLKEKYYNKVKNVLPIRKVAILSRIERQFRAEVLKRLRDKRH